MGTLDSSSMTGYCRSETANILYYRSFTQSKRNLLLKKHHSYIDNQRLN